MYGMYPNDLCVLATVEDYLPPSLILCAHSPVHKNVFKTAAQAIFFMLKKYSTKNMKDVIFMGTLELFCGQNRSKECVNNVSECVNTVFKMCHSV